MTEDEARQQFARTPEAQEIWARVRAAYDTGADPWPIRDEYDAAEAAYVAAHATTPEEPDFHDKWETMTAEEQHEYMHGGEGIDPELGVREGLPMGYHAELYDRALAIMDTGMWHPDGGNGRVPYHTLKDDAPQAARDLWAQIDRDHSRAMARNVKQNILNQLRKRERAGSQEPAAQANAGGRGPAEAAEGGPPAPPAAAPAPPELLADIDAMIARHRDVTGNAGARAKWERMKAALAAGERVEDALDEAAEMAARKGRRNTALWERVEAALKERLA